MKLITILTSGCDSSSECSKNDMKITLNLHKSVILLFFLFKNFIGESTLWEAHTAYKITIWSGVIFH